MLQYELECSHIGKTCTYHFLLLHFFSFNTAGVLRILQAENQAIGPPDVLQPQQTRYEMKEPRKI